MNNSEHGKEVNGYRSSSSSSGSSSNGNGYSGGYADELNTIKISDMFDVVRAKKKFVLSIMFASFLLVVGYFLFTAPRYESSALVQVENGAEGMNQTLQSLDASLGGLAGSSAGALRSQIEAALIGTRFILQPTIESLGMNVKVEVNYFPLFGSVLARMYNGDGVASPWLGLSSYAWGGEKLVVKQFDVSQEFLNVPFRLVAAKGGGYKLYSPNGDFVLEGVTGKLAVSTEASAIPNVSFFVAQMRANPGATFKVEATSLGEAVKDLANNLQIIDIGLDPKAKIKENTHIGVLNITLNGTESAKLPSILNTIIYYAIKKNTSKKTAEAQKTLRFLDQQVLNLKDELDKAETALTDYKAKQGVLGVSTAATFLLEQLVSTHRSLEELKLKKEALLQEFTDKHPYIISIKQQQKKIEKELAIVEDKVKELPQSEQKILSLKREVEVKSQLYLLLLNKVQQLQITKEGTISDIRVLGLATEPERLPSKAILIILGSLVFSGLLAIGIVFLQVASAREIDDPDYVEERLGVPIYAVIPYSKRQMQLARAMKRKLPGSEPFVLSTINNKDLAIEGLRSLRTMLQFAEQGARNNVIAILGSSPSIGKSFTSLNLAYVFADSGKRVLLIDADLRKGKISSYLMQSNTPGLSEVLAGEIKVKQAIRVLKDNLLDFIPSGKYPSNPAELFFHHTFENFIASVRDQYDLVIIDTPPVLAVTDAILIARQAGINLMLLGSHTENLRSVKHAIKILDKGQIKLDGLIFNNTQPEKHGYKYGYYNYGYGGKEKL